MSVSRKLRRLAAVVDGLEDEGVTVVDASIDTPDAERQFRATVELELDPESSVSTPVEETDSTGATEADTRSQQATDAGVDSDGTEGQSAARESTGGETGDGTFDCPAPDCDATFESEPGMKIHRTKVHLSNGETGADDDSEPAYRDPERLRAVYADHETFPAMQEALDADVSTQTIRRHMIKHGIHDPNTHGDGSEDEPGDESGASNPDEPDAEATTDGEEPTDESTGEPEEPTPEGTSAEATATGTGDDEESDERLLTDGASLADALPEPVDPGCDLTVAELRDGIEAADTLYDVQKRFDLDREQAQDLLEALDLLELVHGRVATRPQREELKAEIDRRIRDNLDGVPV